MAKIIILRGNSGSGKSTVAHALQRRLGHGTLLLSQDYVRREMVYVPDVPNNQAVDLLETLVAYGFYNCKVVILEGIFYTDIYECLFQKIKQQYGDNIFAYYFDIPFEETLKRHATREKAQTCGAEEMKKWWRDKDYLADIEEKRIYKEVQMNNIVESIYRDISR